MPAVTKPASEPNRVHDASFVAGATKVAQLPPPVVIEVAFAGRSNVGKSSLLNAMMQRKNLVRTSNTPGCTRQINVFESKLEGGLTVHLVNLPGYGYARLSKSEKSTWGVMLEDYLRERVTLRALAVLVNVRRGVEADDLELLEFMNEVRGTAAPSLPAVSRIVVATKLDKLPLNKRKPALDAFKKASGIAPLGFSAVTNDGRDDLWGRIRASI